jgi:hypothetical protein
MTATSVADDGCADGVGLKCRCRGGLRSTPRPGSIVVGMSIAKDDIRADWQLGDTLVVKVEGGDGDGTDGDGGDSDGSDGDGTDGTEGDGTDGDGSDG